MTEDLGSEQLALLQATVRKTRTKPPEGVAAVDPVARVVVDVALPHLDRTFDYAVPESMAATAVPGVRVGLRFSGQSVTGWVVERAATTEVAGPLAKLARVISPDPVLTPETIALARAVADRYAGTLPDVLRSAVPPRHAAAETAFLKSAWKSVGWREPEAAAGAGGADAAPGEGTEVGAIAGDGGVSGDAVTGAMGVALALPVKPSFPVPVLQPAEVIAPEGAGPWAAYPDGEALLDSLRRGVDPAPRRAWTAAPGQDWAQSLAHLAAVTAAAGRGVLLVAPDARDVRRLDAALTAALGKGRHVLLTADLSPSARYRAFLRARHGAVRVVVGTRAAAFAPVPDLGLLALWDDGDDSLAEPRAPYWHAREVLNVRAQQSGAALVVGSYARSVDVARSVRTGWLNDLSVPRTFVRQSAPLVRALGGESASDFELARDARRAGQAAARSASW